MIWSQSSFFSTGLSVPAVLFLFSWVFAIPLPELEFIQSQFQKCSCTSNTQEWLIVCARRSQRNTFINKTKAEIKVKHLQSVINYKMTSFSMITCEGDTSVCCTQLCITPQTFTRLFQLFALLNGVFTARQVGPVSEAAAGFMIWKHSRGGLPTSDYSHTSIKCA